jgi:hypothetical protein
MLPRPMTATVERCCASGGADDVAAMAGQLWW